MLTQKLFNQFAKNFIFSRSRDLLLTFLLSYLVWVTSKIQVNFWFKGDSKVLMIESYGFSQFLHYVFKVKEFIVDIPTELLCLSDLENPGGLSVQHILRGTGECVL